MSSVFLFSQVSTFFRLFLSPRPLQFIDPTLRPILPVFFTELSIIVNLVLHPIFS